MSPRDHSHGFALPDEERVDAEDYRQMEWKKKLMEKIGDLLQEDDFQGIDDTVDGPAKPLVFEDVLGKEQDGNWWRLFIDPKDWDNATKYSPDDEGLFYDRDRTHASTGLNRAMTAAYDYYLTGSEPRVNQLLDPQPSTEVDQDVDTLWKQYEALWIMAKPAGNPGFTRDGGKKDQNITKTFSKLPNEMYKEEFVLRKDFSTDDREGTTRLVMKETRKGAKQPTASLAIFKENEGGEIQSRVSGEWLHDSVSQVFGKFHAEMDAAETKRMQLASIARVVRNLHVMHPFSEGSGRTNVGLLLPAMLLKYGFGLPLGGKTRYVDGKSKRAVRKAREVNGKAMIVDRGALHFMFSGGYSVDEIAQFLWVVQDMGRLTKGSSREVAQENTVIPLPDDWRAPKAIRKGHSKRQQVSIAAARQLEDIRPSSSPFKGLNQRGKRHSPTEKDDAPDNSDPVPSVPKREKHEKKHKLAVRPMVISHQPTYHTLVLH